MLQNPALRLYLTVSIHLANRNYNNYTVKTLIFTISLMFLTQFKVKAQTEFVLEPSQSMIMTGKGSGQDGTINPYIGQDCYAIVKNIGKREFFIRVQQDGKMIEEISILEDEMKKVKLLKGYELYLDPNPEGIAKASVDYEPIRTERDNWWLWTANWNHNNNQISVGGTQDTLRLFSSETYQLTENIPLRGTITKTKWHPIKNKLAISMQDGTSKSLILDPLSKEQTVLDSLDETGARALGWNKNGELLAVGDYSGFLNIYNENGKIIKRINTKQKGLIGLDWHPKKNIVTVVGERISIYDFENDSIYDIKPRKEDVLMLCVAWNPNGEFFVTGDYGDFEKDYPPLLQFWSASGENLRNIDTSKAEFRNLKWSKDGKILATASESLRLWNENGDLLEASESGNLLWGIDWNKLDSKIVTTDEKGKIIIWDRELNQIQELKY